MIKTIAIPVNEQGILDAHFGHCKFFMLIQTDDNRIVSQEKVIPPPHEPGVLPRWLADQGATDVIAGGMGQRAIQIFNQHGVNVFVGAPQRTAEELVNGFINETIAFAANYCDH
jgi:predicted Fe-Mo cluster-binding NifX family protein